MAHPVTRDLPGRNQDKTPPTWGRWFRIIGANKIAGQTVMTEPRTGRCWCWTRSARAASPN